MKAKVNIYTNEWCNLVFEGKNKEYGAYEIRQLSPNQHAKGIFFALLLVSASIAIPFLKKNIIPDRQEKNTDILIVDKYVLPPPVDPVDMDKPVLPKSTRPTIQFTPPQIVDEIVEGDLTSQEKVLSINSTVWSSTNAGDEKAFDTDEYRKITEDPPKDIVYVGAEQMPEFPGGMAELARFLQKNMHYPAAATENQISGRVFIQFVVNKLGEIRDIKVIRGLEGGCTEEAVRVVRLMPNWKPAKNNGSTVSVYFNLPIVFSLAE